MDNTQRTAIVYRYRDMRAEAFGAICRRETSLSKLRSIRERLDMVFLDVDRLCSEDADDPLAVAYRARLGMLRAIIIAWIEAGV